MRDMKWNEHDPHGADCARRFNSAAECTCGKLDELAEEKEAENEDRESE